MQNKFWLRCTYHTKHKQNHPLLYNRIDSKVHKHIISIMKVCAACYEDLPKDSYSKKQWKLDKSQRRCKLCVTNNREVQLPPSKHDNNNNSDTNEIINKLDTISLNDVVEISDEELFKQPSQKEDCPICFLLLPTLRTGWRYYSCCGKVICSGCAHAPVFSV